MKKSLMHTTLEVLLITLLASMLVSNVFVTSVNAQETEVKVIPPTLEVGEEGVDLPTPPFTINITVTNVTDLYNWQIKLYFNSTILKFKDAWLPPDHVFAGKSIIPPGTPRFYVDENGTYLLYGCAVIEPSTPFSGSGTLCQINFTAMNPGVSPLTFGLVPSPTPGAPGYTYLEDYWRREISARPGADFPLDVTGGTITVKGNPAPTKGESVITIDISPWDPTEGCRVFVGDDVTISGAITPVQGVVNVKISYRKRGTIDWIPLAEVPTDSESRYTYTWTTTDTEAGTYEIMAYWPGDADTWEASVTSMVKDDELRGAWVDVLEASDITIDASPRKVSVGDDVTISGAITPVQGVVNVIIQYKKRGAELITLAAVTTDSESRYNYTWTTTKAGTYEIMAGWPGDEDTREAYSEFIKVSVGEEIGIILYAIAGVVVVIIILAIVIYFVRFRKRK